MACPTAISLIHPRTSPHPAPSRSRRHDYPRHAATGHMCYLLPHRSSPPPRSYHFAKAPLCLLSLFVLSLHAIIRTAARTMLEYRRYSASVASAGAPPTPSAATSPSAPSLPPVRSRTAVRRRHIARAICDTPRAHALAAARRSHSLSWPRPSASWPSRRPSRRR